MDALKGKANGERVVSMRERGANGVWRFGERLRDRHCAGQDRRVFEPFFTTKPEGLDGLAISRTIVEATGKHPGAE